MPNHTNESLEELLFDLAVQKPTAAERAAFLDGVCRDNPGLRATLEGLLSAHFGEGGFLPMVPAQQCPAEEAGLSAAVAPRTVLLPAVESPMVGRYKLLEKIGEGGFGEVWMAEQREPVKRRVALKVIKLGMDSRQVVARFEAERQALALMEHASIAKVFDAGTTDLGRPYFVMELVRGASVTEYCDKNALSAAERLKLFIQVCQAIQHAHQKGIIHRDIKPSNVLVTLHDGVPVPKVIDFGIAKATQFELTDKTVFTQFQQFIGTPAYISPEQAESSGLDIDTRSDIYSLGVLLYELLVGQTPFDAHEIMKGGLDALRQIIREQEPQKPSTRLRTLAEGELTTTAERRDTDGIRLTQLLRGDLDWIVMKCLEKDRTRRYETANGLAMDIQRYLANEPVVARPPSTAYRIKKAWQRNKLVCTSGAVVAVALLVGSGVSTWQAVRAKRATRAEIQQRLAAESARAVAQEKQQEAEKEKQRADRETVAAQRTAYAAQMLVAQADWETGNVGHLRDVLKETASYPDRGFEWYYWLRMIRLDRLTLRGHSSPVRTVQFSPDDRLVATGADDGLVQLWDAQSGRVLHTLKGDAGIKTVAFSPSGDRLASGNEDGHGTLWDVRSERAIGTFEHADHAIDAVVFSPDGGRFASAGGDGRIRVWDSESVRPLPPLIRHDAPEIPALAWSADGRRIISGGTDGITRVSDASNGQELWKSDRLSSPRGNGHYVVSTAWAADSGRVYSWYENGMLIVHDAESGRPLKALETAAAPQHFGGLSPEGGRIISASGNRMMKLWEIESGREIMTLRGHEQNVQSVAFSHDGRRVISGSRDTTAKIWELDPSRELLTLPTEGHVVSIAFSPDGRKFISTAGDLATVHEAETGSPLRTFRGFGRDCVFFPDSRRIAGIRDWEDGRSGAVVLDSETGDTLLSLEGLNETAEQPIASPGGASATDLSTNDASRRLLEGRTRDPKSLRMMVTQDRLALSRDGTRIYTSSYNRSSMTIEIKAWDSVSGRALSSFSRPRHPYNGLEAFAVSPDGLRLVTSGDEGKLEILDSHDGRALATCTNAGSVTTIAFSPDGRRIVSANWERTGSIWEVESGRELATLKGHTSGITCAVFSPDGRRVASSDHNNTVKVWESDTGRELLTLKGHTQNVFSVAFAPDGRRIVSGANVIAIWRTATPESRSEQTF